MYSLPFCTALFILQGLKGIAESFGVVIHCEMINSDTCILRYITCYYMLSLSLSFFVSFLLSSLLRMKDSSACDWVISYFEGRPFEGKLY